jgi:hypothetical protein
MSTLSRTISSWGQPLGDVRCDPAGVPAQDFDLPTGDGVAVLLHVEFDPVVHLRRRIGKLSGIGQDQADFDRLLGLRRRDGENGGDNIGECNQRLSHHRPLLSSPLLSSPDPTSRSSCPRLSRASTSFAPQMKAWMAGTTGSPPTKSAGCPDPAMTLRSI